jgi:hypothetical protein
MEYKIPKDVTITRKDLCMKLSEMKDKLQAEWLTDAENIMGTTISYSDVIDSLLEPLIEADITQEGRFEGSKGLAGKKIMYKVK